ncbi:hypothetical protein SAMN04488056_10647 [Cohaesibacter marisflavi]|uniref:Response regulatory domain-containing protein n=1 Tax=Cohaesibacter marisflavi TaxID=655353 RepID=A0A1I5H5Z5_9HYPH|nr:hypothetical protein [Cohaesibacter marisflavi]SFO43684.1 hypothetical protein SAMN04488056_10647 [Cohaesibacter marisflavi]
MTTIEPNFLIVESWYVVALELQYHVERFFGGRCRIVSSNDLDAVLLGEGAFACIICDTGPVQDLPDDFLRAIQVSKIPLVFTTSCDTFLMGVPGFETVPVLGKPYQVHDLVKAITMVMRASSVPPDSSAQQ